MTGFPYIIRQSLGVHCSVLKAKHENNLIIPTKIRRSPRAEEHCMVRRKDCVYYQQKSAENINGKNGTLYTYT